MGREVVVTVTNGRLDFGTWERIFYGEFDGRRRKRVLFKSRRHAVLTKGDLRSAERCSFGIIGE
jgi:hypothetical protein